MRRKTPEKQPLSFLNLRERKLSGPAIESSGNSLHQLLHQSVLKHVPILITLASRKVYVGYVTASPSLKPDNQHLSLLPVFSGYREKDSLKVVLELIYPDPEPQVESGSIPRICC